MHILLLFLLRLSLLIGSCAIIALTAELHSKAILPLVLLDIHLVVVVSVCCEWSIFTIKPFSLVDRIAVIVHGLWHLSCALLRTWYTS